MAGIHRLTLVSSTVRKHRLSYQIVLSYLLIALAGVTHAADKKHEEKEFIFDRYGSPHSSSSILK